MISERSLRYVIGVLAFLWSIYHVYVGYDSASLAAEVTGKASEAFAVYSEYFGFASALYIFSGYEVINGTRRLLPVVFLLYSFNLILGAYAFSISTPLLGPPIPFNFEIVPAETLDFLLLILTTLLWVKYVVR